MFGSARSVNVLPVLCVFTRFIDRLESGVVGRFAKTKPGLFPPNSLIFAEHGGKLKIKEFGDTAGTS